MYKSEVIKKEPIPMPKSTRKQSTKYPWEVLGIEESFIAGEYDADLVNRINALASYYEDKLERKFSLRKVAGKEEGLFDLRVWRTA